MRDSSGKRWFDLPRKTYIPSRPPHTRMTVVCTRQTPSNYNINILLYYYINIQAARGGRSGVNIYIYIFFLRGGGVFENKTHTEQAKHEQHKKNHVIFLNILKMS